ncbi:hypothetical protein QR680_019273 [Steinernema hermaphroditum]|uniref:SCP domain-containing protein n=1 Tax=Steinernema hermaphroditum TaxID=289476 RepID=A0AA39LSC1_9BILA|nr:hypothetical protein QR680_019273 [Steinernema hermaphroditum]
MGISAWMFFVCTTALQATAFIEEDLAHARVAAVELGEIECSSIEMECYNVKINLSEPNDNMKISEKKKEVLNYYCTDIDESTRARNRRGVLSMFLGGALKPLQLVYDAFIHYKVLGLTNEMKLTNSQTIYIVWLRIL